MKVTCEDVIRSIPIYCYGEASAAAEEAVESHVAACQSCARELEKQRVLAVLLDGREGENADALIAKCRADLRTSLRSEPQPAPIGWMERLRRLGDLYIPLRVPVGALALVATGFFAARVTPERFGGVRAGVSEPMFQNVRSVEPDASGRIQIAVDDIQRRMVSGSLHDPRIQQLLLTAVREESNPGVRVESIGILTGGATGVDSEDVRGALLDALTRDPSPGVRLKAMEGLKHYAGQPAVRKTLASVLLKDEDSGVRTHAIDLLTAHHDDSIVGILQDVVQKEDDRYVRDRCTRLLEQMKASVGTY